jgi:hypothetical protein
MLGLLETIVPAVLDEARVVMEKEGGTTLTTNASFPEMKLAMSAIIAELSNFILQ